MKTRWKELPLTAAEVRELMKKEDNKKCAWIALGISVIAILVGVIIWVAKKREKDLEEHYEYFDDDFEELDEDYDDFDESIYDNDDEIEYVKISDFMNYDDENKEAKAKKTSKASDEVSDKKVEEKEEE